MSENINFNKMITYDYPAEIPIGVWAMPATWFAHGEDMICFAKQYPEFFPDIPESIDKIHVWGTYNKGTHVDEWGCVWSNNHHGMEAIVTGHPVKKREDIRTLQIPPNKDGRLPHGFMYLRLLDLRGFEEAMLDFAEECDELQILIDKVCEYNRIQIECALPKAGLMMSFGDDLGMQKGLAIGTERWRKYLKPCFAKLFKPVRDAGKYIYMHTDGWILDIIPDLFECGITVLNPQIRPNGLHNLSRICKGKYPIHLDLDRQLFPFATPSELDDHVREAVEELYLPQGGLGISIDFNPGVPLENMAALLDAARKYRHYRK